MCVCECTCLVQVRSKSLLPRAGLGDLSICHLIDTHHIFREDYEVFWLTCLSASQCTDFEYVGGDGIERHAGKGILRTSRQNGHSVYVFIADYTPV